MPVRKFRNRIALKQPAAKSAKSKIAAPAKRASKPAHPAIAKPTPRSVISPSRRTPAAKIRATVTEQPRGIRQTSKLAAVIALLQQKGGTTLEAMCKAAGWQSHSVRGLMSGTIRKKLGLDLQSEVNDGVRSYRIVD